MDYGCVEIGGALSESPSLIRLPGKRATWMQSHMQLPVPWVLDSSKVRVFFASRDLRQRSHVGSVDLELSSDDKWQPRFSEKVVAGPGPIGSWSEDGVYPSSLIEIAGRNFMYVIGWNRGRESPLFQAAIGVLDADRDLDFKPLHPGPILARGEFDPLFVTAPMVFRLGSTFGMTYVSGIEWVRGSDEKLFSRYDTRLATSLDGLNWSTDGSTVIELEEDERNISRTWIEPFERGGFEAWFSVTNPPAYRYQLAYATSEDGRRWVRSAPPIDAPVLDLINSLCPSYPAVFELAGRRFLLSNAADFGRDGFWITPIAG